MRGRWLRQLIAVTTRRLKLVLKLHDWYQDTRLGMRAVKGFQTEHMTRVITDNIYSKFCSFSEYKKALLARAESKHPHWPYQYS